jgi:glycosyltransferase involved in cell wall biosynthesis
VIAFARGSANEIVEDGITGFLVHTPEQMADRVRRLGAIDRSVCRARARERFSSLRMAHNYERVYQAALRGRHEARPAIFRSHFPRGIQIAPAANR